MKRREEDQGRDLPEEAPPPQNQQISSTNDPSDLLLVLEAAWNKAALNWDVNALADLYTDDALFYGARPGLAVGRDGVLGYFKSYIGFLKSAKLHLIDQHIRVLAPDAFIAQGYGRFEFLSEARNQGEATLRTTWTVVRSGETWKIALHHFSLTPEAPPIPE